MIDIKILKEGLIAYTGADSDSIKRFVSYVDSVNRQDKNGKDLSFGISIQDFVKLYSRYANVGITIDGTNAVLAGYNKVFITWVGYKNKVLSVYPESEFDTQLVRKGDATSFAKESGSVVYSHEIADPFSSNVGIIGAYCVIKNKRGEFLETLGSDDFETMKESAMMKSTWDKWESEFWLKSVIKRACKRHFNDVVEEIEKIDNEDYQTDDYVKYTTLEKNIMRYEGYAKWKFPDIGYDNEVAQKNFTKNVIKKDKAETQQDIDDLYAAIEVELEALGNEDE